MAVLFQISNIDPSPAAKQNETFRDRAEMTRTPHVGTIGVVFNNFLF